MLLKVENSASSSSRLSLHGNKKNIQEAELAKLFNSEALSMQESHRITKLDSVFQFTGPFYLPIVYRLFGPHICRGIC